MPTLYHYSPLIHLPAIMRDGLCKGEVAHIDLKSTRVAVSLTTQTDPTRLMAWNGVLPMKTAVRYTCRIPDGDPKLEKALDAWRRLGVPPKFIREGLNPHGQAKWWSFYHGTIPTDRFDVELWGKPGYVLLAGDDLGRVATEVEAVRDKFEFVVPPDEPWSLAARLKDETDETPLWLLDESHPADRFLVVAS